MQTTGDIATALLPVTLLQPLLPEYRYTHIPAVIAALTCPGTAPAGLVPAGPFERPWVALREFVLRGFVLGAVALSAMVGAGCAGCGRCAFGGLPRCRDVPRVDKVIGVRWSFMILHYLVLSTPDL